MRYRGVSPGAKLCYARLYRYAGENGKCFPPQRELAPEIGVTERQVRSYLRELEKEGFIRTIRKGLHMPNEYEFRWHPIFAGSERQDTAGQERKKPSGQERKEISGPIPRESKKKNSPPTHSLPSIEGPKTKTPNKKAEDDDGGARPRAQFASDLIEPATGQALEGNIPPPGPTYQDFKRLYPAERLDDAKAHSAFDSLAVIDRESCLKGLLAHLRCERWVKSPRYIPLASNFIRRREYTASPPPYLALDQKQNDRASGSRYVNWNDMQSTDAEFYSFEKEMAKQGITEPWKIHKAWKQRNRSQESRDYEHEPNLTCQP